MFNVQYVLHSPRAGLDGIITVLSILFAWPSIMLKQWYQYRRMSTWILIEWFIDYFMRALPLWLYYISDYVLHFFWTSQQQEQGVSLVMVLGRIAPNMLLSGELASSLVLLLLISKIWWFLSWDLMGLVFCNQKSEGYLDCLVFSSLHLGYRDLHSFLGFCVWFFMVSW